jgi:hypothetical protein
VANLRILIPEILGSQAAVVTANSEASASLADDNLLTPEPWQVWRSSDADPKNTYIYAGIAGSPSLKINGMALVASNLLAGNGEVLGVLSNGNLSLPPWQELVPSAIASISGMTGVVGNVDEGSGASDGLFIDEDTAGGGGSVVFDFPTPTAPPRAGAKRQCFVLRVKSSNSTDGGLAASLRSAVTVSLVEGSTILAVLGKKAVFGPNLHILFFSWDAALLGTADGSAVRLRIDCDSIAGYGNTTRVDAVSWRCESDQLTGDGDYVTDTGWTTILPEPESGLGVDYSTQMGNPYSRWSHKFATIQDAVAMFWFLREDHVEFETPTRLNRFLQRTPPGYVQAGRVCAGLWWEPTFNRAIGQFATTDDPSSKVDDGGGGEWGSREETRDTFKVTLNELNQQEMAWLRKRLLQDMGTLAPFYIELEPDATFELGFGGWVTVLSVSNPVSARNGDYPYSMEFVVRIKR